MFYYIKYIRFYSLRLPRLVRVELGFAKAIGVATLLILQIYYGIKDRAYAGFGIVLISASIAMALFPIIIFAPLAVSNIYLYKKEQEVSEEIYSNAN